MMAECHICNGEGDIPFCRLCYKMKERELVYLPSIPKERKKKKKQKKRKPLEQILQERKNRLSYAEQNLEEIREQSERDRVASLDKWMQQLEAFGNPTTGSVEVDVLLRRRFGNKRFEPLEQRLKQNLTIAIKSQNQQLEEEYKRNTEIVEEAKRRVK